ncbi:MAG: LPS export ABC transporter periplasmic protein LptC [Stellaceae bacterium]
MRLAISRSTLRAQRHHEGEPKAAVLVTPAWIAAAWPSAAPDNRHSRRVAVLKRLLPAIGLALLLLIAVWPQLAPLWDRMRLAFPAIDLREARQLRMVNPHYAGLDRMGRPFVVTAAVGRQVPDRQDLMSLEGPRADMKSHAGADIVVTAATGIYQSQAQIIDLFGDVTLVDPNGTRFVTDTARVDVANNAAEGSDPVEGQGPSGDVKAQGFRIRDKGDSIIFTGKSDMLLKQARPGTTKSAPAALPPPVAAAAARVEAEAKPALRAAMPAPPAKGHAAPQPATANAASGHPHPVHRPLPTKPAAGKKA